ncbi:MAG: hypothetical protein PVI43_00960 [Candidatus Bathyarchaeota archaeon]
MEHTYREAVTLNLSYWAEADTDTRFYAGDQTLWNDLYGNLPAFRRKQFNFNRIRRVVNMITGYQRQHQKSIIYAPREAEDQQTADQFTKLAYWANSVADINHHFSEAFEGAVVTGQTLFHVWWDFRTDPINGEPAVDVLQYNDFLIDPYYRKQDLSDCNYIWRRKWMNNRDVASLLPQYADEIMSMEGQGANHDGKFYYQPEAYNYGFNDLLMYDEYYYRTYRKGKMLVDKATGATLEWQGTEQNLKAFLQAFPHIDVVDQIIPTVEVAILVNGHTMYCGPNPLGDNYPFVPLWCYYEPQLSYFPWRVQGVVRNLRDSQYLYNRRKVIELDILESTINQGWIYKEDSLVDPESVYQTSQGRQLALKKTAQMTDIQRIDPPQVPPSMIELSKILGEEIAQISGVNEELLGSAADDKAGILSMLRQGAGLVTLQKIFDQADFALKLIGKLLIKGFQNNFTSGKVQRIINEEPSPQFTDRFFAKYDVAVEEGAYTNTQKQLELLQLLQLREIGIPVPPARILEATTVQNKNELIEQITQAEQQQQQMAMAQAQAENEVKNASVQSLMAKAQADQGLAVERASRVEENQMLAYERMQEGQKDRAAAALDQMKAIKELQGMDLDYVQRALAIIDMLQRNETVGGQQEFEFSKAANTR